MHHVIYGTNLGSTSQCQWSKVAPGFFYIFGSFISK